MIDPNSITDQIRQRAEPLWEGGQFTVHDAYIKAGATALAGDPRLDRLVTGSDTSVVPGASPIEASEPAEPESYEVNEEILASLREQHQLQFGGLEPNTSFQPAPTVVYDNYVRNRR
jgi:hypothetical protein